MRFRPRHYYDMVLLALEWLARERDEQYPRSIPPILQVLVDIKAFEPEHRTGAQKSQALHRLLQDNLTVAGRGALYTSPKHLAVWLPEGKQFNSHYLLSGGPKRAYRLFITDSGIRYAQAQEGRYLDTLRRDAFLAGWQAMRDRDSRQRLPNGRSEPGKRKA